MSNAARELNVTVATVYYAKRDGRLDSVGTQPMKTTPIIVRLAKATPEDFPDLQREAKKWLAFKERHSK